MQPASAILDEHSRRRPDFIEGEPIRLMDGQTWHFARPRVRVETIACKDGPLLCPRWFFPGVADPETAGRLARVVDHQLEAYCRSAPGSPDCILARLDLAAASLIRNYRLSAVEMASLITFGADRQPERFQSMWVQIYEVIAMRPLEEMTASRRAVPYRTAADYLAVHPGLN